MHAGLKYRWHLAIVSSASSAHISAYSKATQTLQTWELLTVHVGLKYLWHHTIVSSVSSSHISAYSKATLTLRAWEL